MFILYVDMSVKPGSEQLLEQTFKTVFITAISNQEGFASAGLMRSDTTAGDYRLVLKFENQSLQQNWVATPLHQEVWPQIESHCASYSVQTYLSV
ncbi:MAG: antibiotic biosynthesis monooxygenase family protein [Granulicella sp.]